MSAASRHGATAEEIGRALREALHERGDDVVVEVRPAEEVNAVDNYDAVVLGSAVYAGHWREPARELAERHAEALSARPTWLFSSGPVGHPPKPTEEDSVNVGVIVEATGARDHQVFSGKLGYGRPKATSATGKPSESGLKRSPRRCIQGAPPPSGNE